MTEAERRRSYGRNRVLIEIERLLHPQFDDTVLHFTGAQVELLRNLMQYARQRDGYVSIYEPNSYLAPTAYQWNDIELIIADMEEKLMGNENVIWGYKERWVEDLDLTCDASGYVSVKTVAVAEGYVHVVEAIACLLMNRQVTSVSIACLGDTIEVPMKVAATLDANTYLAWAGRATLEEGDQVLVYMNGTQEGDTFTGRVWGHKMVVP